MRSRSFFLFWTRRVVSLLDDRGVAAVEFALILPVMLLLYVGTVDVSRGVSASRKLDVLSRSLSDLTSQQPTASAMTSSTIANNFTAAAAIMAPFPIAALKMTVSAIDIKTKSNNTCCDALVRWSYTQGGTLRTCTTPLIQTANGAANTPSTIPAAIITSNQTAGFGYSTSRSSYIIVADVGYSYAPFFYQAVAWFGSGMSKTTFMVPRAASSPLTLASPINAAAGQSGVICF